MGSGGDKFLARAEESLITVKMEGMGGAATGPVFPGAVEAPSPPVEPRAEEKRNRVGVPPVSSLRGGVRRANATPGRRSRVSAWA